MEVAVGLGAHPIEDGLQAFGGVEVDVADDRFSAGTGGEPVVSPDAPSILGIGRAADQSDAG